MVGGHTRILPRDRHNPDVIPRQPDPAPERGFIVAVLAQGADPDRELAELRELARTALVEPIDELVQHRARPERRTYVGKGKLEELKHAYREAGAEVLLVDDELEPAQQRTLENTLQARVVDRTQLILDIFAQHATSAEGKLQVELAQLEYNLPRMRGMWQHLERLGGGVGTRGPGESQLETDRRLARRRITLLRRRLGELRKQRDVRRKERRRAETPTVALAGYTNVGKSTLLNALTDAEVSVDDRLFETLDPTTRGFDYEGRRYLVTDTVGFIRRLPTELVEGFAATLEETLVADLILHVVDASVPEDSLDEQIAAVNAVLAQIGADGLPIELVLNKVDAVDPLRRRRLANRFPDSLQVSALTGAGLEGLRGRIAARFADRFEPVRLLLPYEDGGKLAELYELGAPIEERTDGPDGVLVRARLPRRELRRFARYLVAEARSEPMTGAR
jgi:GTPase